MEYRPDGGGAYTEDNVGILYHAFHTTRESRKETQPWVTPSSAVLTWDGRLDNREELVRELKDVLTTGVTDLAMVAAAYETWGTKCFAKLIGDWALSVWDPRSRSVILAKDPIGTRHLYYSLDNKQVTWSTILDPLVFLAGKTFALEEEYIAGWLSFFPATHLTPYVGIHSVPPSCFVRLEPGRQTVSKYWDFNPGKRIRYRTDGEYEEHFRQVFGESVRRRLRSDGPLLAELSGGMDSSSIVCMADTLIASEVAEIPRLDTLSYYNDSEPNWNERPYFTKVEEERGRVGSHIDVGSPESLKASFENEKFAGTPSSCCRSTIASKQFAACLTSQGNRVVLSGIGGDEITGGVPSPTPELADLLVTHDLAKLARQLKSWALNVRKPWFHLFLDTVREFFPAYLAGTMQRRQQTMWLQPRFVERNLAALIGYERRLNFFGPLPSFQENLRTFEALRRQVVCDHLPSEPVHEKRYPYLDRDFVEFMYAIPREQVLRPGQRRSLTRRALIGIVPEAILQRKRKAFASRGPLAAIVLNLPVLRDMTKDMLTARLEIIDVQRFSDSLQEALNGREIPVVTIFRTLEVESWLRTLRHHNLLSGLLAAQPKISLQLSLNKAACSPLTTSKDPAS